MYRFPSLLPFPPSLGSSRHRRTKMGFQVPRPVETVGARAQTVRRSRSRAAACRWWAVGLWL